MSWIRVEAGLFCHPMPGGWTLWLCVEETITLDAAIEWVGENPAVVLTCDTCRVSMRFVGDALLERMVYEMDRAHRENHPGHDASLAAGGPLNGSAGFDVEVCLN